MRWPDSSPPCPQHLVYRHLISHPPLLGQTTPVATFTTLQTVNQLPIFRPGCTLPSYHYHASGTSPQPPHRFISPFTFLANYRETPRKREVILLSDLSYYTWAIERQRLASAPVLRSSSWYLSPPFLYPRPFHNYDACFTHSVPRSVPLRHLLYSHIDAWFSNIIHYLSVSFCLCLYSTYKSLFLPYTVTSLFPPICTVVLSC